MSNTVDVEALVASFRRLLAKSITEVAGIMCSRGEIAALLDALESRDTALSTLARKLDWALQALADETKRHLECEALSEAQLAKMADALKPFAEAASDCDVADDLRTGVVKPADVIWESSVAVSITFGHIEAAREALSTAPAAREVGVTTANCCHCGRIVDTREKAEGGDDFGCELSDGRWTCSPECWEITTEAPAVTPEIARLTQELEAERRRSDMMRVQRDGHAATLAARDAEIVKAVAAEREGYLNAIKTRNARIRQQRRALKTLQRDRDMKDKELWHLADARARARDGQVEERGQTPTVEVIEIRKGRVEPPPSP